MLILILCWTSGYALVEAYLEHRQLNMMLASLNNDPQIEYELHEENSPPEVQPIANERATENDVRKRQ